MTNYRDILEAELERKQKKNPAFSLRSFAKSLGVSHTTLSQVLSGKRTPSYQMANKLLMGLDVNKRIEEDFLYSIAHEHANKKTERMNPVFRKIITKRSYDYAGEARYLELEKFKVISDWYHYAIFVMIQKDNFKYDTQAMANTLNLKKEQVKRAIERLISLNIIKEEDETLKCVDLNLDTTDKEITSQAHKKRQEQSLEMSIKALKKQDINQRNHSTMTMAIDPKKIPEAKRKIHEFMKELCDFLDSGEKKEIYELQTSLFSLEK